ncbi:MAG: hypothetical protein AB7G75_33680 [Candidatus Binatia bacterium]
MAETILDHGAVWWPAGLPAQERVRVVFNIALQQKPTQMTCVDYETREPLETRILDIEPSGTRQWMRYTAVTVQFLKEEQRGRPFRWRVFGEE